MEQKSSAIVKMNYYEWGLVDKRTPKQVALTVSLI
jgi:hypothetical protein